MTIWEISIAALFLAIQCVLKLLIGRIPSKLEQLEALYELPIDIAFLAASFAAVYCIKSPVGAAQGFVSFLPCLIAAILVVFISRLSISSVDKDQLLESAAFGLMSYSISTVTLFFSMNLVSQI